MFDYLQSMLDEPWKPVSRPSLIAWLVFYLGFPRLRFLGPWRILVHRHRQSHSSRGRAQSVRMVRCNARPLGRHAAAVVGPVSARRILLYGTPAASVRVLRFFLLRKLALHRNLYGRCASADSAAGYNR